MKKVVAVVTSPRENSNSEILADAFLKGAGEAGNETEKIRFSDHKIGFCRACNWCRTHDGVCVQQDDMNPLLKKLLEADVIVLASPVYKSCVCGQLKTFADRMYAINSKLTGVDFYFIASAGSADLDGAMRDMEGIIHIYKNVRNAGRIYGSGLSGPGEAFGSPAYEEAYRMGKNC